MMNRSRLLLPALILLFGAGCASAETRAYRLNEDGSLAYYQGEYDKAVEHFRDAQIARPDLPELNINAGAAIAKGGDRERALQELRRTLSSQDAPLKSKARYDIGTVLAQDQREAEAIQELKWALRLEPSDGDAKHNLEILVRRQQQREEEQRRQEQQKQDEQRKQQQQQQQQQQNQDQQQQQPQQQGQDQQPAQQPQQQDGQSPQQPSQQPPRTPPQQRSLSQALEEAGANMSIEDALKILDALRERERQVQSDLNRPGGRTQPVEKDW